MTAGLLLTFAIASEVVGTILLKVSDGFSKPVPAAGVVITYLLSVWLLALALKELEIGFAYAVWAGVGTAVVAVVGVMAWNESLNVLKVLSLMAVIAGVIGLNLSSAH